MKTMINKAIATAFEKNKFLAYYANIHDSEHFSVGKVIAYDEAFLLTAEISPEGAPEGYSLQRIDNIYRVDIDDSYTKGLTDIDLITDIVTDFIKDDLLNDTLEYLKRNGIVASISLNPMRETDLDTVIKAYDDTCVLGDMLDESGLADGKSIVRRENIISIFWD